MRIKRAGLAGKFAIVLAGIIIGLSGTAVIAGIAESVHNLGITGSGPSANGGVRNQFSGTAEICVFCHTPHGGDSSAAIPLWNRHLNSPSAYQTYDQLGTSTFDAQMSTNVGSVSIGCLSCHDGTLGMDSMINEPGSGADNPGFSAGVWNGEDVNRDTGRLSANIIQNLGTDLTNDHPIGMQYAGGGVSASRPKLGQGETNDPDFAPVEFKVKDGRFLWWVDHDWRTGGDGERTKKDVMLYTRDASNGYEGQAEQEPFVECASCHDPHETVNPTFLRVSNTDTPSGLCLTCHVK